MNRTRTSGTHRWEKTRPDDKMFLSRLHAGKKKTDDSMCSSHFLSLTQIPPKWWINCTPKGMWIKETYHFVRFREKRGICWKGLPSSSLLDFLISPFSFFHSEYIPVLTVHVAIKKQKRNINIKTYTSQTINSFLMPQPKNMANSKDTVSERHT